MDRKRFKKQVAFILEADKEKNILRQTHLSGHGRRENDAEHAWHMAMMIYLLKEYANAEFDLAKTMMMALIHDIVETREMSCADYLKNLKRMKHQRQDLRM